MARALSKKRRGFINDFAETGNASLSVKKNYKVKNDETARAMGSELLTFPNVIAELSKLGFDSNNAKRVVAEILNDDGVKPADRLNAAEKVFKVNGDLAPEKHIVVTKKFISFDV